MATRAVRTSIAQARAQIRNGALRPSSEELLMAAEHILELVQRPNLRLVINATGVIINTNLGRAPLSQEALQAVQRVAGGYSNLEYALEAGGPGSRHAHFASRLSQFTRPQAPLVPTTNTPTHCPR